MELDNMQNFGDLSNFIYEEYLKITENFGVQKASETMISFTEKALKKYFKLYNKPLYERAKRELKLQKAIDTMPHSKLWIFCHQNMWAKIQERLGETKNFKPVQNQNDDEFKSVTAELLKSRDVPQISEAEPHSLTSRIDYH